LSVNVINFQPTACLLSIDSSWSSVRVLMSPFCSPVIAHIDRSSDAGN